MTSTISIWEDADVRGIYELVDGNVLLRVQLLDAKPLDALLIDSFIKADMAAGNGSSPASEIVRACLTGITAYESLSSDAADGWRKFLLHQIDLNNHLLWDLHRAHHEVAAIGEWTVANISARGWGPDGNATALGQRHSNAMALAAAAGGGMRLNPLNGRFEYGTGQEASDAADRGSF